MVFDLFTKQEATDTRGRVPKRPARKEKNSVFEKTTKFEDVDDECGGPVRGGCNCRVSTAATVAG